MPRFQNEIRNRINNQLSVVGVVTGEAGISKSYTTITICRVLSKKFSINDVVSTYAEYMRVLLKENKQGVPIMFDEPQYAMDKRDWYNQVNKALIKTITSQRFRLRPLFIPIINMNLLDKVLRSYLVQYHIIIRSRGEGDVYVISQSHFDEKVYHTKICSIEYGLFEPEGNCKDNSCLRCNKLEACISFRSSYERKKASWMKERDEAQLEEAEAKELIVGEEEILNILYENKNLLSKSNRIIDAGQIIGVLRDKLKLRIGRTRAFELKGLLTYRHPELKDE
jgi:hypothetical protein